MRLQDIKNIGHFFLSLLAIVINGYPARKLKVIGVTGTDGKTTVVNLIYHLLKCAGKKVGMISTIGARINSSNLITTGLHTTTPSPFLIQRLLKQMGKRGCEYAVIEVTSHALDQHRVLGCNFFIGVITNVSHEHLDYHKTIKQYLFTKLRLLKNVRYEIINNDDQQLKNQKSKIKMKNQNLKLKKIYTYGVNNKADFMAKNIIQSLSGASFDIFTDKDKISLKTSLLGEFNVYNILAAFTVVKILGINDEVITKAVKSFQSVKGRMEEIKLGQPFKVFIDFGHTPQAFEAILTTIRKFTKGKIIHVFGATGMRDKTKRPLMGEISGKLADLIVITSEDTYGENQDKIISSIENGVKESGKKVNINYWVEPDRQMAINKAIKLASINDTVVVTGVGHQTAINKGQKEIPWSEVTAVKKAVAKK